MKGPAKIAPPTDDDPKTKYVYVKDSDLILVAIISGITTILLCAFGYVIVKTGLLQFPDISSGKLRGGIDQFFQDALDYRERRMALALAFRTFLTGFSFVVGLALCTQGGIFILRQVTALTTLSGSRSNGGGDTSSPQGGFSFMTYSPGVAFMAGGVLLMIATQMNAIQIKGIEVVPSNVGAYCESKEHDGWGLCISPKTPTQITAEGQSHTATGCDEETPPNDCFLRDEEND